MHTSLSALDSAGTPPSTLSAGQDGASVSIPDAHFLFHADFKRAGSDLILTGEDGHRVVVPGYFKHEHLPTLLAPNGGAMTGDVVEALVGPQAPDQYAQAGTQVQTSPLAIGRVASLEGGATAFRNGVQVSLNVGDVVIKGDVIQTSGSSAVGVIFSDGTTFSLSSNARMVLNDFVYSPGGSANSALINLVQGSITFVAGEVAHTGDMRVGTPVATMGIRGTAVNVTIHADQRCDGRFRHGRGRSSHPQHRGLGAPTPEDLAAGRLVGAQLGIVTNNDGVFSFIPTPNGHPGPGDRQGRDDAADRIEPHPECLSDEVGRRSDPGAAAAASFESEWRSSGHADHHVVSDRRVADKDRGRRHGDGY